MEDKKLLFFDIDTQYDFMIPEGALYVKDAETIIPNLKLLTEFALANNIKIFASADSHTEDDPEFKQFPPHCLGGSAGNRKIKETFIPEVVVVKYNKAKPRIELENINGVIFTKNTFDVFSNPYVDEFLSVVNPDEIYLYGVATDYCVKAAAESLLNRDYSVTLIIDAIKAVNPADEKVIIDELKKKGLKTATTNDVVREKVISR